MAKRYVGIDIGTTAVRVAVVSGVDADGFAIIDRFGLAPVRPDAFLAGKIRNPEAISIALLQAIKSANVPPSGIGSPPVIVGLSTPDIHIARFALPAAIKRDERVRAIRAQHVQVSPTIPLDAAAVATDLVSVATNVEGKQTATLSVAAAAQEEVDLLLAVCQLAGIEPRAVDLSAAGTFRALVRDSAASTAVTAIVDVGASQTTVMVRQGVHLHSVRSFATGGLDLTKAIAQKTKEPFEVAERRKWNMHLPATTATTQVGSAASSVGYGDTEIAPDEFDVAVANQTAMEVALAAAADSLVEEIASAIEQDYSNTGVRCAQVALCGGSALLKGLKERLQRRLNIEVRLGHPWAHLAPTKENEKFFIGDREDPRIMLSLACATGLAMWRPKNR